MCKYNAKINNRGMTVFIDFIKKDVWANKEKKRKKEMNKLLKMVKENK